jgi:hypothetical protein
LTELRLAYIQGLHLATVLLALAYIVYASGWDKAASARLETLLEESVNRGLLNKEEHEIFDRLREVRNSYTHYRAPAHPMSGMQRALTDDTLPEDLLETDALMALRGVAAYVGRREVTG